MAVVVMQMSRVAGYKDEDYIRERPDDKERSVF